jgi:outer membrane protein OmpA-like peptidoglycan-associated protein
VDHDGESTEFQYRVQIAASASEIKDDHLKKIYVGPNEIHFFKEDGYYKYYIEETPNYPDARRILKESGVKNAFIAAYRGNTKWKLNEAIASQKNEGIQQAPAGNENTTVDPQRMGHPETESMQQDNATPTHASIEINKKKNPDTVAEYSMVDSQLIAAKENPSHNNEPEKTQVGTIGRTDNSVTTNHHPSGSLEANRVVGESDQIKDLPLSSSADERVSQNNEVAEENPSANKNGNAGLKAVTENPARIAQQNKLKAADQTHDVSLKNIHAVDSSQHLSPVATDHTTRDDVNNDFEYRIQIAASRSKLSDTQLKKIYKGAREVRFFLEDGYYKYYIGEASRYYVASQILKESNTDKAFISVYKGDTKWQLQDAIASQNKMPLIRSELAKTDSLIKIVTVNFDVDEFVLPENERSHLQKYVIGLLKTNEAYYTIVNGYADIRGSEAYNFGLSQERAFFVEQLILDDGIDPGRVATQYFGESQLIKYCPENENCDESVHQANRRVEILLLIRKKQRQEQSR